MQITNSFTVPIPVDEAWEVLLDVERVAPCMPGATLESVDGETFGGRVKVKVGPVNLTYKGRAEFTSRDAAARTATLTARGRDSRGQGTAAATVTMRLIDEGRTTGVELVTELDVTGRPAQLGRGVMTDVGNKIIGLFAEALAEQLAGEGLRVAASTEPDRAGAPPVATPDPTPARPVGTGRHERAVPDSINVLGLAGGSILTRIRTAIGRLFRRLLGRPARPHPGRAAGKEPK